MALKIRESVDKAYGFLTSKVVQRTLLYTIILSFGAAILYGCAVLAYIFFYNIYLPDQIRSIPVHLQYGYSPNPYGMADLRDANFMQLQHYDISVALTMPRSRANLDRGNFMVELYLMGPGGASYPAPEPVSPSAFKENRAIMFSSFRPALLPYTDPLVSLASRLLFIVYHIFRPFSEKTTMRIPMAETLSFPRGASLPSALLLEIQGGQALQTYSCEVVFVARLYGLRWFMYNFRIASFVIFSTLFWVFEVAFMLLSFLVVTMVMDGSSTPQPAASKDVKKEEEVRSETKAIKEEPEETTAKVPKALPPAPAPASTAETAVAAPEEEGYEEDVEEGPGD